MNLSKSMFRRIGGKRGFTLIELLIVMSIIAVLVAVVALSLTGFLGAGEKQVCEADKRSLQGAVLAYYAGNEGQWPSLDGNAPGDIDWGKLVPGFANETPKSDTDCDWQFDANGMIDNANTTDCPCD